MTAERTVSSPGVTPRDHGFPSPVSVVPPRGADTGPRLPAAPPRTASPLPLLVADGAALLPAALVLSGAQRHPLLVALLIAVSLLLRPRETRPPVPGLLEELPAVCGRVAVAWAAGAVLWAAYRPQDALFGGTELTGLGVQAAAACALRAVVHGRRRA
ncbi:transferase, partial [Streptomyces heliomycini]